MTKLFLASFTTRAIWWVSKNPSSMLMFVSIGLISLAIVIYYLYESRKDTYAEYLRVYDENYSNIQKMKLAESASKQKEKELLESRRKINKLETLLEKEKTNNRNLKEKSTEATRLLAPLRMQLGKAHKTVATLSNELDEQKAENQNLLHQMSVLEKSAGESEALINKKTLIEKELEQERKVSIEHKEKYNDILRQIAPLRMQLGKEQRKAETLSAELDARNGEIISLQQQISLLEKTCADDTALKDKVAQLERDLEAEKGKAEEAQGKHDENLRLLNPIRMQLGKARKSVSTLTEELNSAKAENSSLQQRIEEIESAIDKKETLVIEKDNLISELESKIASSSTKSSDIEELEKERDLLVEQLEVANSERNSKSKELQEFTILAEERGTEIERLNGKLRETTYIIEALNAKILALEALQKTDAKETEDLSDETPKSVEAPVAELQTGKQTSTKKTAETDRTAGAIEPESESAEEQSPTVSVDTEPSQPSSDSSVQPPVTSGRGTAKKKPKRPIEEADEDVDLPVIENKTGIVKRSILQVVDVEHEEEVLIDSDEFFSRSTEEIENVARMLAEAAESGREAYLCACCRTPVKIAKRDFGNREVLFFSHCTHDVSCEWKQEHSHTSRSLYISGVDDIEVPHDYKSKYREIKILIKESLMTKKSLSMGVSNVEVDKKIRSKYKFICHRTAGIYARYNDKDIVIELQTKDVLMNTVVNKDIFYRLNNHHVIWVFGADEGGGYGYINKHVHRNTMFANHRNVFIMDKEAMEACRERGELVLKCNYLDPDDLWHYRKETTGSNGILISLNDLSFDEDMCKPYYYDANKDCFIANPESEKEYNDNIVSKEKLLKDLKDTWEGKMAERRKKQKAGQSVIPIVTVKREEPIKTFTGYTNRYTYSFEGKKGIVDARGNFIIPCEYSDIQVWTRGKYRVKKIDLWGVIDESGKFIVDIRYKEISKLTNGKALVKKINESYYIYENGYRVPDEEIKLPNGWIKYRYGNSWGISDANGNKIVDCIYDEIGSFRRRLIGFKDGQFPTKLTARYEYRLPFACKCVNNIDNRAHYDINGVNLMNTGKQTDIVGKVHKNMHINNICYTKETITVSILSEKKARIKIDHVDLDSDFLLGETISVTIDRIKVKKIFVTSDDGRQTYFTKSVLRDKDKCRPGERVTITKVGFDHQMERTIWVNEKKQINK